MAAVIIGVDPQRDRTRRWRSARTRPRWARCGCGPRRAGGAAAGLGGGLAGADLGGGGRGRLGHLLAQQLVAAGERVLDVQPELAARVRLLATGAVNKNDPDDARSVAVAALRSRPACRSGPMTTRRC